MVEKLPEAHHVFCTMPKQQRTLLVYAELLATRGSTKRILKKVHGHLAFHT